MLRLLILGFVLVLGAFQPALAERRLAFVAGIDSYPNLPRERQLQRAVKDAETVGDALQALGFQVTRITRGVTQEAFLRGFGAFVRAIEPGDTALFFFAGHGIALDGTNYLIPADIPALASGDERLVRSRSMAETDLIADIRERGARVTVMVIDACRDNPFPKSGTRALGGTRGLAVKEPAEGVFSIYSAGFGQEALDRLPDPADRNPNSVFTRVFVDQLKRPGVNLLDLGETVREEVATLAKRANHPQVPAVYNQVLGARRIFLAGLAPSDRTEPPKPVAAPPAPVSALPPSSGPALGPTPALPPPAPGPDEIAWSVAERTANARQVEDLIRRFPQSRLRPVWEARLTDLKRQQTAALEAERIKREAEQAAAEEAKRKVEAERQAPDEGHRAAERRTVSVNAPPLAISCFGSDRGAASTDASDHLRWAEARDGKALSANLAIKINALNRCATSDDQIRDISAGLSVVIAQHVPRAECFRGDRGVTIPSRQPHRDWAAAKSRQVVLANLQWKTSAAIGCLDRLAQARFFADMSSAIAMAAASFQAREPSSPRN